MVQDTGLSANTGKCKDLGRFDVHTAVERKWRLYSTEKPPARIRLKYKERLNDSSEQ